MTPDESRRLDRALAAVLPQPAPDAVARLRARVAREIARSPLPAPPGPWQLLARRLRPHAPAGWGALAAMAGCALWLGFSSAPRAEDPLAPLQPYPLAGEEL